MKRFNHFQQGLKIFMYLISLAQRELQSYVLEIQKRQIASYQSQSDSDDFNSLRRSLAPQPGSTLDLFLDLTL